MTLDASGVSVPAWTIGDLLRKAREHAGLEQTELAEDLGISRATVSNYERGHVRPRKAVVMAWAMRTRVPVGWLQTGQNPRQDGGPDGGSTLPRLDSNQKPFGYTEAEVIELRPVAVPVRQVA
jgi:transcriptional regulator with XRE-family HTH domain